MSKRCPTCGAYKWVGAVLCRDCWLRLPMALRNKCHWRGPRDPELENDCIRYAELVRRSHVQDAGWSQREQEKQEILKRAERQVAA